MKKIVFASALSIVMLACGERPGSGTDSNQSNGSSNMNSAPANIPNPN
ncbi:MAG: hypothetical protein J7497_03805 [Chitinophagaceae bacterium]|nr:hypothetical protein [Chitinophagaceae bacterium]